MSFSFKEFLFYMAAGWAFSMQGAYAVTIDDVYNHLKTVGNSKYAPYEGISYAPPSANRLYLDKQPWLLQTPKIEGGGMSHYNMSFLPILGNKLDPEFNVPQCQNSNQCQGAATCQEAEFTLDKRKLCLTPAYHILGNIHHLIVNANASIDILTLGKMGFANGGFSTALKNSLTELAKKTVNQNPKTGLAENTANQQGSKIVVRLLEGSYVPFTLASKKTAQNANLQSTHSLYQYLNYLTADLPKGNKLVISIANMRSCQSFNCGNENDQRDLALNFSWNHAKVINVDNYHLITGGENLWGDDYLGLNPVNDANIELHGLVAKGATVYANKLWNYVHRNKGVSVNYCYTYENGKINSTCPGDLPTETTPKIDASANNFIEVKAMPISKLNNGVGVGNDADQSEIARVFAFQNAVHSIKISQQAIYTPARDINISGKMLKPLGTIDGNLIEALAQAIHQNAVEVYIITSSNDGLGYSSNVPLSYISNALIDAMVFKYKLPRQQAQEEVNQHLHLGYLSDSEKTQLQSHHKFWMVDDHLFYFGSHNFYAASLQEFGVIVDSEVAGQIVLRDFWNLIRNWVRTD